MLVAAGLILAFTRTVVCASDKINSSALSHYIMGVFYDDLGEVNEAIEEYRKALSTDSTSAAIHLNLATSLIKKNDLPAATEELKRVIILDPEAVEPHAILAVLYSVGNKADLALGEYETALKQASKLNSKDVEIYQALGALYLKQHRLIEALGVYRIISGLSPDDPNAHFYIGAIYGELKNYELCEKELRKAIGLKPDYAEALNYLGYELVEWNKDLNQAELMIKKALFLEPDNGAYLDSLGWLYYKKAKLREARELLEKASSLMEDPVIYDHLGDVYSRLKEIDQAKLNWQKSLKLDPKQDSVKKKIETSDKNAGNAKSD